MAKIILMIGAIFGTLSVAIGAFGAHALRSILEANQRVDTFELASRYQFYHSLAIIAVGLLLHLFPHSAFQYSAYSFVVGILIFSGSLYVLALSNVTWLGAITPLGGVALILGWVFMIWGISKSSF